MATKKPQPVPRCRTIQAMAGFQSKEGNLSEQVQRNTHVLRHWFDTLNKRDIAEIRKVWEEICTTEDYVLHDPGGPSFSIGFEDTCRGIASFLENTAVYRIHVQDMFGVKDKVVTLAIFEPVDVDTQEKQKTMGILISRFENGKIAEEWQIVQPIADPAA